MRADPAAPVAAHREVRLVSWMDDPTPRPPARAAARRGTWQPAPPAPPPAAPPPSGRDVALSVYADGDELVILLGDLAGVGADAHLRAQDAALEAARVALLAVPRGDARAVRMVANRDHVIVRAPCPADVGRAVAVARGVLDGWKAGAL